MTRVYICEQWNPAKNYWEFVIATDSAVAADRWRRKGIVGRNRKFVDYVVLNEQEFAEQMKHEGQLEGVNQEK